MISAQQEPFCSPDVRRWCQADVPMWGASAILLHSLAAAAFAVKTRAAHAVSTIDGNRIRTWSSCGPRSDMRYAFSRFHYQAFADRCRAAIHENALTEFLAWEDGKLRRLWRGRQNCADWCADYAQLAARCRRAAEDSQDALISFLSIGSRPRRHQEKTLTRIRR